MYEHPLEFWFDFASPYSYIAAMRIEQLCSESGTALRWMPFQLGPIFVQQGWDTSHFNLNPLRGAYMWRDMERLAAKYDLPWRAPSEFPRKSVFASRVAAAHADAPWIGGYIRRVFVANFGDDSSIEEQRVIEAAIRGAGADSDKVISEALQSPLHSRLRKNTERAMSLRIFGAPNCVVNDELFWGEETLEDAIDWAKRLLAGSKGCGKSSFT